jgi:hypothetical protein
MCMRTRTQHLPSYLLPCLTQNFARGGFLNRFTYVGFTSKGGGPLITLFKAPSIKLAIPKRAMQKHTLMIMMPNL